MILSKDELHAPLLAECDRLRDELAHLEEQDAEIAAGDVSEHTGYGNHLADDATETFEHEKRISLRKTVERRLRAVEEALGRFERGEYGLCERCGTEIDLARLEAIPYTSLCLRCQRIAEMAPRRR
ncbi:MAG: TraR/DksA family transcriptional regulator [Chloroflexi bacterium]|nr:TraR/DksA family transcriptional regulator [Chloroflexota bacterium]MBU1747743.1 TraR/DksA family transcriptional regulator [Chloroflexota bacterium]MBU1878994.1 TraR/DksA family transcriptional regulator [Chloroflexota bacterium]